MMKETKELTNGIVDLACEIIAATKSNGGLGADDLLALVTKYAGNEKFRNSINEAIKGADKIPAEFQSTSMPEVVELALDFVTVQLPKIQTALKG